MFPIQAKCVTFDAGWPAARARAREHLELGKAYTIRRMTVGQSDSYLEFYDIEGTWSTVFFDACPEPEEEDYEPEEDEPLSFDQACEEAGWYEPEEEPPGGNDPEAQ